MLNQGTAQQQPEAGAERDCETCGWQIASAYDCPLPPCKHRRVYPTVDAHTLQALRGLAERLVKKSESHAKSRSVSSTDARWHSNDGLSVAYFYSARKLLAILDGAGKEGKL